MTPQDFLLEVFCLVDDELQALNAGRLRSRGPQPALADSEVIAIELVGEFWGLDTDKALFRYFRGYPRRAFPILAQVSRTTFARQAANRGRGKQLIQQRRAQRLVAGDPLGLVDRLPLPACPFARATFCQRLRGGADYGYDHLLQRTFYGFRLHLRTSRDGVILAYQLASARASEKAVLSELDLCSGSVGIGDRHSWDPALRERLAAGGVQLLAPYQHKSKEPDPARSARLAAVRYRIETVGGQLTEHYRVKRTWARDLWHLCRRIIRKILSHTVSIWLTVHAGIAPLSFDRLVAA